MRILFFNSIDKDIFGGLENWIGIVAAGLIERGHDVTIAGRPGSDYLRRVAAFHTAINVLPVPISGDFNPITISAVRRFLVRHAIEIVVVNFNKDIRLAGLAARWYGPPRVIWRVGLNIAKKRFIHRWLTPRLIDGVITPSHALKNEIVASGYIQPDQVEVIHNGTLVKATARMDAGVRAALRSKYNLPADAVVAVTSGRFVNHKGHRFLIEAAAQLQSNSRVWFLLLGDGYMRDDLERLAVEHGVRERFIFAGMLDDLDLELAGADLAVHPSIIEPFSNAILEYMRAGLPVVATNVGGTSESVIDGESGVLVPPGEPAPLAHSIDRLAGDEAWRGQLGAAAQKRWRDCFTVNIMVDKVENNFAARLAGTER